MGRPLSFVKFEVPQQQPLQSIHQVQSTRRLLNVSPPCSNCQQFGGQFFSATAKRGNAYQFEKFGTGEGPLVYGRRFHRHSVQKTVFWCTEWTCGTVEGLLVYATRFQRPAEQPTPQTVNGLLPLRVICHCPPQGKPRPYFIANT